jgi:hypothetical protein
METQILFTNKIFYVNISAVPRSMEIGNKRQRAAAAEVTPQMSNSTI